MDVNKFVLDVNNFLQSSPVRKIIISEKNIPFKDEIQETLNSIQKDFEILESKLDNPVKVVLMGEVKAGKSTLLNALAGAEISPTDVLEATAAIIEVYYSEKETGCIEFRNKENFYGDLEQIKSILKENHRDLEFFNDCEKISIGLPLQTLRKIHIVDTPGLATITQQNEKKTYEYVQNADVVLWVLNSTHLGQEDVIDAIENVSDMGKNILGILNKIDCVTTSKEDIINYATQEYGIEIDEFFTLSAFEAFSGVMNQNYKLMESSGFIFLLDYILNKIDRNADKVQKESIVNSMKTLVLKDVKLHSEYYELLETITKNREKYEEAISSARDEINNKVRLNLNSEVNNLLMKEYGEIIKDTKLFEKYISNEYITNLLNEIIDNNRNIIENNWDEHLKEVQVHIGKEFEKVLKNSSLINNDNKLEYKDDMEIFKEGALKGLATSGGAGGALAFYAAVLGPAASSVTIVQAATVFCPPILLAGAVAGIAGALISKKSKDDDMKRQVQVKIEGIKNDIRCKVLPHYLEIFEKYNKETARQALLSYEKAQGEELVGEQLDKFKSQIKIYNSNGSLMFQ